MKKSEIINNTALGVLPWYHRNVMRGEFGSLLTEEAYLPIFRSGGFEDCRTNFMEAEVLVPPSEDYCRQIITLFPYTHRIIPEFNQLQEGFFEDTEIIQAIFGHELGETTIEYGEKYASVSPFDLLLNTPRMRQIEEREEERAKIRHKMLDKVLVEMGLGQQTKKMLELYRDKAESLLPKYKHHPYIGPSLQESIRNLDEDIAELSSNRRT